MTGLKTGGRSPQPAIEKVLLFVVLLICSPVFLYLSRTASTVVVGVALLALIFVQKDRQVKARIDVPAGAFLLLMLVNGAASVAAGQSWIEVVVQLVPVAEVFFMFRFARQILFSAENGAKWIKWMLVMVLTRAAWQLAIIVTGQLTIVSPVYGDLDPIDAAVTISNFTYIRPIDPVMGLFVALGFVLYVHNIHRRLALAVMGLAGAVCILGLIRAEWIATLVAIVLTVTLKRQFAATKLISAAVVLVLAVLLVNSIIPDLTLVAEYRLFDYTVEQMENPANEESQLRVLEVMTAFNAFRAAPLFGNGIGSGLGTVVFNGTTLMFEPLHNYYLNLLAKTGFAGLALLVLVGFCALKLGRALHASARCDLEGALALCAITSLIWWGIFIALHPVYVTYHVTVLVGVFFGMALALQVPARPADAASGTTAAGHA